MSARLFLAITLFTSALFAQDSRTAVAAGQATGIVNGRIVNANSKPLHAIIVMNGVALGASPKRAFTGLDGTFHFDQLPAGTYTICAQILAEQVAPTDDPYIDSCEWPMFAKSVTLAVGQASTAVVLIAQTGVTMRVRVNDPQKLLATPKGPRQIDPLLQLDIRGADQIRHSFPIVGTDSGGRDHALTVPRDTYLNLTTKSSQLSVKDETAKALTSDSPQNLITGTIPKLVIITVGK